MYYNYVYFISTNQSYCMTCVYSQLKDLTEGKGTASYYRRQVHKH